MARVNITLPDDIAAEAKRRGWNISRMTMEAIRGELDRQRKIEALDVYLAQLDDELGPIPADQIAAAERFVDRMLAAPPVARRDQRAKA